MVNAWQRRDKDEEVWEETVEKIYILEARDGGTFVIQGKYFMEATEGFEPTMDLYLRNFHHW